MGKVTYRAMPTLFLILELRKARLPLFHPFMVLQPPSESLCTPLVNTINSSFLILNFFSLKMIKFDNFFDTPSKCQIKILNSVALNLIYFRWSETGSKLKKNTCHIILEAKFH